MNRFQAPRPGELDDDQRRLYGEITGGRRGNVVGRPSTLDGDGRLGGPFGPLLLHPRLGQAVQHLGSELRFDGDLPDDLRELVILLVASHWRCAVEWSAHAPLARSAGLSEEQLGAIAATQSLPDATAAQRSVVEIVGCLVRREAVDDDDFNRICAELGHRMVAEVCALFGYYALLAGVLATFAVRPLDENAVSPWTGCT